MTPVTSALNEPIQPLDTGAAHAHCRYLALQFFNPFLISHLRSGHHCPLQLDLLLSLFCSSPWTRICGRDATCHLKPLGFAHSKYLRPAYRAHTLSCWPTVLQGDLLRVFNFPFLSALHTVGCWHDDLLSSLFLRRIFSSPIILS
jgi:hypothetical protein